jgi:hypothetical protein
LSGNGRPASSSFTSVNGAVGLPLRTQSFRSALPNPGNARNLVRRRRVWYNQLSREDPS